MKGELNLVYLLKADWSVDEKAVCELFADTKEEVKAGMQIKGIDASKIAPASTIYTKTLDVGVFDSNGNVNWL